jgi:mono/diheme cytochrome c family protein
MEVPMTMTFSTKRFLITTALVTAVGCGLAMPAAAQDAAKKGQEVYTAQKCQLCHAVDGKGNKANPLDGVGGKRSAAEIKLWITNPTDAAAKAKSTKKPPMPNKYASLPAADLDALVAYMQSLK